MDVDAVRAVRAAQLASARRDLHKALDRVRDELRFLDAHPPHTRPPHARAAAWVLHIAAHTLLERAAATFLAALNDIAEEPTDG